MIIYSIFKYIFSKIKTFILLIVFLVGLVTLLKYNTGSYEPINFSWKVLLAYLETGLLVLIVWFVLTKTEKLINKMLNKKIIITNQVMAEYGINKENKKD